MYYSDSSEVNNVQEARENHVVQSFDEKVRNERESSSQTTFADINDINTVPTLNC